MGRRESIFQAVCPTRVFRHIATNAAHRLRRRVRSIEKTLWSYAERDLGIDHARFHHCSRIGEINFENVVHACQADDDALIDWQRATAQASARTASYEGNFFLITNLNNRLHLRG